MLGHGPVSGQSFFRRCGGFASHAVDCGLAGPSSGHGTHQTTQQHNLTQQYPSGGCVGAGGTGLGGGRVPGPVTRPRGGHRSKRSVGWDGRRWMGFREGLMQVGSAEGEEFRGVPGPMPSA